jgi:ribosome-associated protein
MKPKASAVREPVWEAVAAVQAKKGQEVTLLKLSEAAVFTDYFLICNGTSTRQVQAISDEVDRRLTLAGLRPAHVEGYNHAEWILMDYVDFVVHIFSEKARDFYGLERLWRTSSRVPVESGA